jgi:hypothetical protein
VLVREWGRIGCIGFFAAHSVQTVAIAGLLVALPLEEVPLGAPQP